jgi:Hemerythrin HHE cation binding domain
MSRTDTGDVALWAFAEREHRDLGRGLNGMHLVACDMNGRPTEELSTLVLGVLEWLHSTLEPHVAWEEAVLYPEIDKRAGTPWATRCARLEHRQIRASIGRLRKDWVELRDAGQPARRKEALADLFALEALLRTHIDVEEQLLIPTLVEGPALTRAGGGVAVGQGQ